MLDDGRALGAPLVDYLGDAVFELELTPEPPRLPLGAGRRPRGRRRDR